MKISEIEKLKNKNSSEKELKNYSLHSFWKGVAKHKGKITKIETTKGTEDKGKKEMIKWLENFQIEIDKKFANIEKNQDIMKNKISNIEKNQDIMQNEITSMNNRISNIEKEIVIMKNDISILKSDVIEIKNEQINMKNDINLIKNCPTIKREIKSL